MLGYTIKLVPREQVFLGKYFLKMLTCLCGKGEQVFPVLVQKLERRFLNKETYVKEDL